MHAAPRRLEDVPDHVLVIGASAAGLSTVESLRRKGYTGRITVVGDEVHLPYDRPPLSKQVLSGAWSPERSALRPYDVIQSLEAEFLLDNRALSFSASTRTVVTASGRSVTADAVVIATGARPRRLPVQDGLAGVHVLRSLDDSLALRRDLLDARRLAVVGEGVLGCEIAATARQLGLDVTLTGPQPGPMALQVGGLVSEQLAARHVREGVSLRLGSTVTDFVGSGRVEGVRLSSAEVLPADVVVVAIGAMPATDWLVGSGLDLENGVVCDAWCRASEGVYAVGDVARWHHQQLDQLIRLENRTNATEQAATVAGVILGDPQPYVPVPYFWSDQFDVKLQVYGVVPVGADAEVVEGSIVDGRFVVEYRAAGVVTGVVGWNMPKQARLRRQRVADALTGVPTP